VLDRKLELPAEGRQLEVPVRIADLAHVAAAMHTAATTITLLRELVADLTSPLACEIDRAGRCVAHGWRSDDRPCPHQRATELLEALAVADAAAAQEPTP
jgi:hypothetical protein